LAAAAATAMAAAVAAAQDANYDEAKVPAYSLPDPLVDRAGARVGSAEQWWSVRRPELLALFEQHVYGAAPPEPEGLDYEVFEEGEAALGGKAKRRQVRVKFSPGHPEAGMDLLLYLPAEAAGPVPVVLGLNFEGNHTVRPDPAIRLTTSWVPERAPGAVDHRATEASRGSRADRWDIDAMLARGFGFATAYCGDIDPDYDDGNKNGLHALFPDLAAGEANLTTIGAWAWGLSRALDYLEIDPGTDAGKVVVFGFSRLGKTALWAGARDPRFAMVVSHQSGCGGAALSRRAFGETVARINRSFPHWFCTKFKSYNDNEAALPVDQHELLALVAPRPLYVGSAEEDRWADPRGEFLSTLGASPVYRLLGAAGVSSPEWPPPNKPAEAGIIAYHLRPGEHSVTPYDWERYLSFAERHLAGD
jgi:hypothetical protein